METISQLSTIVSADTDQASPTASGDGRFLVYSLRPCTCRLGLP